MADRTGVTEGEISLVLKELRDAIIFFNRAGRGVKLEGLGTYQPKVGLDGTFDVAHRVDSAVKKAINAAGTFSGNISAGLTLARPALTWSPCGTKPTPMTRWRDLSELHPSTGPLGFLNPKGLSHCHCPAICHCEEGILPDACPERSPEPKP